MPADKPFIEPGSLASTGEVVYRMNCPVCRRHGVWQKDLSVAENTLLIHNRNEHGKAAA